MRINRIAGICCFIVLIFISMHKSIFADTSKEYTVKAAFILNFVRYAKWPDKFFTDKLNPCLLCVIGDRSIEPSFRIVAGEKIGSRKLVVNFSDTLQDAEDCHIIFITQTVDRLNVSQILESVKGKPVLTIGEKKDFTGQGGMIGFFTKKGRLYFEVNMDIVQQQNIKLSSRLLKLATLVCDK